MILAGTALLLAMLSAAIWQFRFENAGPSFDLRIRPDFRGWTVLAGERITTEGDTWVLPAPLEKRVSSAEGPLPGLEATRHVDVRVEVAWENVTRHGNHSWWSTRISLGGKRSDGTYSWPQDGDLINGVGSRRWHKVECVFDLPPDMGEPRIFINNLAGTGVLKVRHLAITPVKERAWIPVATVAALAAWFVWVAGLFGGKMGRPRQMAAALAVVAAGWYLVFPQPHHHARPFPGGFMLGEEIARPTPSLVPVTTPVVMPVVPAASPPGAATPVSPLVRPERNTDTRTDHPIARAFRDLDNDLSCAHVAAFGAFGLALFSLAGLRAAWPLAAGMALLSEMVPNLLRQEFKADDAMDLLANFSGLILAALLMAGGTKILRRIRRREN